MAFSKGVSDLWDLVAKVIDAPVFHVNADDIEAVTFLCQLAADWRARFHTDCVIDLVCYRKQGHNELDQPMYTQPVIYRQIAQKVHVLDLYTDTLVREGIVSKAEIEHQQQSVWDKLSASFDGSKDFKPEPNGKEWLTSPWDGFKSPKELALETLPDKPTAVESSDIDLIANKISNIPEGFAVHKNLQRILASRKTTLEEGKNIE